MIRLCCIAALLALVVEHAQLVVGDTPLTQSNIFKPDRVYYAAPSGVLAYAETCNPPNVARTVEGLVPTFPLMTLVVPYRPPALSLSCPKNGACQYVLDPPPPPPVNVICLTPTEHEAALERGR